MYEPIVHPMTMDGRDPGNVRGDPISGERYYAADFARLEWDRLWKRIWHVAGRLRDLAEPGDYIVHNFMQESVIAILQDDGSIRAFYNSCGHRGQRLVWNDAFVTDGFRCPYHGWLWGRDGVLKYAQDHDVDFPQGDPCGKLKLRELTCETWGGFVWYSMDPEAPPLMDFLSPIPEIYKNYPMDTAVRVFAMRINVNANWKFVPDNFSESYHTRTAHPQVPPWIDQDVGSASLEMFPTGHGRTIQPMRPSLSDRSPLGTPQFDETLRFWGIDPDRYPDFETKAIEGWKDLKAAKARHWAEKGYVHYAGMNRQELTEAPHTVLFPNITLSFGPDYLLFWRSEPHLQDPNRSMLDMWCMVYPVEGEEVVDSIMAGPRPLKEVEVEERDFDQGRGVPELAGQIIYQDLMLAEGQQWGMKSQGYRDAYLAGQETRVRFFHERLNDYLAGGR
jgi:phenylpropionate dioxygenase-like ring-hydroxylating dioxygenase large terminal subunit